MTLWTVGRLSLTLHSDFNMPTFNGRVIIFFPLSLPLAIDVDNLFQSLEPGLDIFHEDPEFIAHEEQWAELKKELIGDDSGDEAGDESGEEESGGSSVTRWPEKRRALHFRETLKPSRNRRNIFSLCYRLESNFWRI